MPIKLQATQGLALARLSSAVDAAGGRLWVVGGTVRDALLGRSPRDLDVEIHGLDVEPLEALLRSLGMVHVVGRSFGVFKLSLDGVELDVALPRADSNPGSRVVRGDPRLGLVEAARRRDLTINAMAWDPLRDELADPLGGQRDLARRTLRAADPARFGDDPLRALRVARFSASLGFGVDDDLLARCEALDLSGVAAERVRQELERLLLAPGIAPGVDLAWRMGALPSALPALQRPATEVLGRVPQVRAEVGPAPRPLALGWCALLSATPAPERVLDTLGLQRHRRYAMRARVLGALAAWEGLRDEDTALRRLAEDEEVALVAATAWCLSGRERSRAALRRARALGVALGPLPRLIEGRDLISLGVPRGPVLGRLLLSVREAQLRGELTTPQQAVAYARGLWLDDPRPR